MVGTQELIPPADSDDTYSLAELQSPFYKDGPVQTVRLSPGQEFTIARKLHVVREGSLEQQKTKTGAVRLNRSSKWFTLIDAEVNYKGEIVFKLATVKGKSTPEGRILKITEEYQEGGQGLHTLFTHTWYQIL